MQEEPDTPEHHLERSEFIRRLIQSNFSCNQRRDHSVVQIPRTILQFWHDPNDLPDDIAECIASWVRLERYGLKHLLFDEAAARDFIRRSLGPRHEYAFGRCYHPAMQADYFRLCYILVEGGFYVDADDVYVNGDINWMFSDGRLLLQPLCYDKTSSSMVEPSQFLSPGEANRDRIFYFNNNPLIAAKSNPIVEIALTRATRLLEDSSDDSLPEIQATAGPGNLSRSIFQWGQQSIDYLDENLAILRGWHSIASSRWPLTHREDARNWRLSNQKRFWYERPGPR